METSNIESSMATRTKKASGKMPASLGTIKDIVESQPKLKEGLEHVMDAKSEWLEEGTKQISNVGQFLARNWKTIVPAIAAVGIGAYFLTGTAAKKAPATRTRK
jgi:hypothetical protein